MGSSVWKEYTAGAIAGIAGLVVGFPFDTTKVQIQIQSQSTVYRNAREAVVNINKQGVTQGFLRGLSLPLFSYGFINSVFFGTYSHTLIALKAHHIPHYHAVYWAGCMGSLIQLIPAVPAEVVKVVMQSQIARVVPPAKPPEPNWRLTGIAGLMKAGAECSSVTKNNTVPTIRLPGPLHTTRAILATRGLPGLYRGLGIQVWRDVPSGGLYFLAYSYLCDTISRCTPGAHHSIIDLFAGGFAGMITWLVVNPLDVVKSKLQADYTCRQYHSSYQCIVESYRDGGVKVFMRGALVNAVRAFPVNAAIFMMYTYCIRTMNSL